MAAPYQQNEALEISHLKGMGRRWCPPLPPLQHKGLEGDIFAMGKPRVNVKIEMAVGILGPQNIISCPENRPVNKNKCVLSQARF